MLSPAFPRKRGVQTFRFAAAFPARTQGLTILPLRCALEQRRPARPACRFGGNAQFNSPLSRDVSQKAGAGNSGPSSAKKDTKQIQPDVSAGNVVAFGGRGRSAPLAREARAGSGRASRAGGEVGRLGKFATTVTFRRRHSSKPLHARSPNDDAVGRAASIARRVRRRSQTAAELTVRQPSKTHCQHRRRCDFPETPPPPPALPTGCAQRASAPTAKRNSKAKKSTDMQDRT